MRFGVRCIAIVVFAAFVSFGCGGDGETIGGGQSGGGEENTFIFGRGPDSVSLDPIHQTDTESRIVIRQIFDGLLDFAPGSTTELIPALASEVPEPEEDGTVYTFPLREGVKFHDGTDFNAEAVVFNFERWKDTDNEFHRGGGAQGTNFSYYDSLFGGFDDESVIENVEAVDEYTVRFTLREPQGPFLKNLATAGFYIASPEAIRDNVEDFWQEPVGTGAFRFTSWDQGTTIRLEKFEDWWGAELSEEEGGGGPYVDNVVFRSIPDNTARVAALTAGELSAADGFTPDDIPTIEERDGLRVENRAPLNVGYMAFNMDREPFDDPLVREAISHAINMEEIVESFFGEIGEVATNPMPSELPFFNEDVQPYEYDPDRARELLEEAGMPDGFETNLYYLPIPRPYLQDSRGIAQAMQRDLEEVGIEAELITYEFGTYIERTGRGEHDMALLGWNNVNGDPDWHLNVLLNSATATETNAQNISYYRNPEVDELLADARSTVDEGERRDLYYEAQEIIHEDAPMLPIAYVAAPVGLQDTVEGYVPSPFSDRFNTIRMEGGS